MKRITIIFIGLLLIVLAVTLKGSFSVNINSTSASSPSNVTNPNQDNKNNLETKESNDGPVAIAITPQGLDNSSSTWNFEVSLNTHSGSIGEDLVTVSELIDDKNRSYKPVSWEGFAPGGHHRNGILKFNPISPKPKSIELKIKNIGGIPERSFKWNL